MSLVQALQGYDWLRERMIAARRQQETLAGQLAELEARICAAVRQHVVMYGCAAPVDGLVQLPDVRPDEAIDLWIGGRLLRFGERTFVELESARELDPADVDVPAGTSGMTPAESPGASRRFLVADEGVTLIDRFTKEPSGLVQLPDGTRTNVCCGAPSFVDVTPQSELEAAASDGECPRRSYRCANCGAERKSDMLG